MSNLWDLEHLKPSSELAVEGETMSAVFWNGVKKRGDGVFMRQKEIGRAHV